jgi:hypothetical protein
VQELEENKDFSRRKMQTPERVHKCRYRKNMQGGAEEMGKFL